MSRAGRIFDMTPGRKTPPGKHQLRASPRVPRCGAKLPTSRQKRLRALAVSVGLGARARFARYAKNREKAKAARKARKKNRRRSR